MKYLIFVMVLFSFNIVAGEKTFKISEGTFEIYSIAGNVDIVGTDNKTLKVSYEKIKWDKGCQLKFDKKEKKVLVEVDQEFGFFSSPECRINIKIDLPRKMNVSTRLGSGTLAIDGIMGNCDFKGGSGNLTIRNSSISKLVGKMGSGNIAIQGEFSTINLKVGSGKLSIIIDKIIGKGRFDAKSGSGDISMKIPKGTTVKADFKSGSGDVKSKVGHSDNSPLVLNVMTGSGDLIIDYLD